MRIVLADDHTIVRAGIRALLQRLGMDVVAEAGDGREALDLIAEHRPDLVLMDITMPEVNGIDATTEAVRRDPALRVLMLSMHANEEYVVQALRAGAVGYLVKDAATTELELALDAIARGENYLSASISREAVRDYLAPRDAASRP